MEQIIFALDIGTTKICAIVGEARQGQLRIIGIGIEPSRGIKKGMIINPSEASVAIARAVEKAEQTSGYDLSRAFVSMAGEHINCANSSGTAPIGRNEGGVVAADIGRALEMAQAISIPQGRQIVHLIPRRYKIDDNDEVKNPLGLFGYRLEVEAHIVTAAAAALQNLSLCTENVGITTDEFVLNALASGEAVLEPSERGMGVLLADMGGGTTDIALYTDGMAWHTAVLPIGGNHITNDIAIGLRVPFEVAERVKLQYGDCRPQEIDPHNIFTVEPFGGEKIQVGRQDLAHVIEARAEEIFQMIAANIKESGYNGLLPAGIVLTGGVAQSRGITDLAQKILGIPARVAPPKNLVGLVEAINNPAYATGVGLLRWAMSDHHVYRPGQVRTGEWSQRIGKFLRALLPG